MFRKRLTFALASLAVASLLQGGVASWTIDSAARNVERGRVASDVLAGFLTLSATKQRLRTLLSQALLDGTADAQQRERLLGEMATTLANLQVLASRAITLDGDAAAANPEHRERQDALVVLSRSRDELAQAMAAARPVPPAADTDVAWRELNRAFDMSQGRDMRSLLGESIAREQAGVARERTAADRSLGLVRGLALGATAALALAAALLALYFTRALRRPLDELSAGADALQRGDLKHRIPDRRNDEFARFARRVNQMAEELSQHRERELQVRQRLEELVGARTTDLEQALYTLQQLDARRRQFFADISHELRTPTTAIRGEAEVSLRGGAKPAEEYRAALQRIADTSKQLGVVIDDLLTIARSDIDALAVERRVLEIGEPLRGAIDQAQALGLERGVRVEGPDGDACAAQVLADAQRLRQLFTLLLDNAVRYSHPQGVVRLQAELIAGPDETRQWQLRISDQGIGIGADALPHIFERNFRSESARLHCGDGSGLGLPIAAALAQAHGGRIGIDSQVGAGTVVTLSLPVLVPEPETASAT